jgi:hypothetical protein
MTGVKLVGLRAKSSIAPRLCLEWTGRQGREWGTVMLRRASGEASSWTWNTVPHHHNCKTSRCATTLSRCRHMQTIRTGNFLL